MGYNIPDTPLHATTDHFTDIKCDRCYSTAYDFTPYQYDYRETHGTSSSDTTKISLDATGPQTDRSILATTVSTLFATAAAESKYETTRYSTRILANAPCSQYVFSTFSSIQRDVTRDSGHSNDTYTVHRWGDSHRPRPAAVGHDLTVYLFLLGVLLRFLFGPFYIRQRDSLLPRPYKRMNHVNRLRHPRTLRT